MNRKRRRSSGKAGRQPARGGGAASADQALETALGHHRAGRLDEAARLCADVLARQPDQAGALHLMGVIRYQRGDARAAVELIRRAVAAAPDDAEAHHNLGNILKEQGAAEEALAAFQNAVAAEPEFATAHNNLAVTLLDLGRPEDAAAACRRAVALRPDYAMAHNNLGLAELASGRAAAAAAACRKALELRPDYAEAQANLAMARHAQGALEAAAKGFRRALERRPDMAEWHSRLGATLVELGEPAAALAEIRKALALDPNSAEAHNTLGNALRHSGKLDEALAAYRRALTLEPDLAEAQFNLGAALEARGNRADAVAAYRRAVEIKPDYAEAYNNLGIALADQGALEAALAACRKALELQPGLAVAHNNLGMVLANLGRLDEAIAAYRAALALDPGLAEAHHNMSAVKTYQPGDDDIAELTARVADPSLSDADAARLLFSLGKAHEDTGDHDAAFDCIDRGNRLARGAIDFDIADETDIVERIARSFDAAFLAGADGLGDGSELPVFIVGMPRSGTTLVEQILASHPDVHGAGERPEIMRLADGLARRLSSTQRYPECAADVDGAMWRELGESYVAALRGLAPDAARITDKMPVNHRHLGLIHAMLPAARIIHCRRDPMDTCFSCYKTLFTSGQSFAYDLTELGLYYRLYERMMRHWQAVLPGRICELRYEDVVADLEGEARRLVAYCGLGWDARCLDFDKTERPVLTASAAQVRRPIYTSSVERWRLFERHLGALQHALGPAEAASDD